MTIHWLNTLLSTGLLMHDLGRCCHTHGKGWIGISIGLPTETHHISNKPKIIQIGLEMKEI